MDWRLCAVLWTIAALKMMFPTLTSDLDVANYGVRTPFRLPDPPLYSFPNEMPSTGLDQLFRLPLMLLASIKRLAIEQAVRGSCCLADCAEAVLH